MSHRNGAEVPVSVRPSGFQAADSEGRPQHGPGRGAGQRRAGKVSSDIFEAKREIIHLAGCKEAAISLLFFNFKIVFER